jgi:hypothetical protein
VRNFRRFNCGNSAGITLSSGINIHSNVKGQCRDRGFPISVCQAW